MALDAGRILTELLAAAGTTAGQQGTAVTASVAYELKILAQRLVEITNLRVSGQIDDEDAAMFLMMARNNAVAGIAMATALTAIAAKRVVDAAMGVVRTVVNSAIGFTLV